MTRTEDEARKCWCPFAMTASKLMWRVPVGENDYEERETYASMNRGYQMDRAVEPCRCIASGCMAWRWDNEHPRVELDRTQDTSIAASMCKRGWEIARTYKSNDGHTEHEMRKHTAPSGHCGLAGEPK